MVEGLRGEQPVVVVDAGGTLSARDLRDLPVAREKARLMARALAHGGIDGMALTERDWRLGPEFVRALGTEHDLPLLAANLVCGGSRPLPGGTVVERGGLRVGVVGLTQGPVPGCLVEDAAPAAERALAELGPVDVSVVLAPGPRATVRTLASAEADMVILTTSAARLGLGGSLPVGTTARGKKLDVVELVGVEGASGVWSAEHARSLDDEVERRKRQHEVAVRRADAAAEGQRRREAKRRDFEAKRLAEARADRAAYGEGRGAFRASLRQVELSDAVADDAEVAAWVQETLGRIEAAAGLPVPDDAPRLVGGRSAWAGSDACLGCHPAEHAQWSGTPHATAWATLRDDQHGRDPACVGCHVTAWQQDDGPRTVQEISAFRGVQCEACHGPSAAHARRPTARTPVKDPPLETCTACHDGERDMGRFQPESYRARVVHTPVHEASPRVAPADAPGAP